MSCGIYKIINLINNKQYIGQSIDIETRWQQHKTSNKNYILYQAFKKYGLENFSFEIIEECSREKLNETEQYWIKYYNTLTPNGYNMTFGGDSCGHEQLEKSVQQYTLEGKYVQQFNSIKEAERVTGIDNANISACCKHKNHYYSAGGFQWKYTDDDIIIKKYSNKQLKPILQYDLQDNFIKEFNSVSEAAEAVNRTTANISSACKRKGSSGGYKWRYKEIE